MFIKKRKNHKRLLFQLTAMILIMALLAGCGRKVPSTEDKSDKQVTKSDTQVTADVSPQSDSDKASNQPATAGESYSAFTSAKGEMYNKLSDALSSNVDTAFDAMSLLGVALVDLALVPVSCFGLGEESVNIALGFLGAQDVEYNENGNKYSVKYKNTEGKLYELEGVYDKAADSMKCTVKEDGKDSLIMEYRKTSFGYVSQVYSIKGDGTASLYKLAISGMDGGVGMSEATEIPPALNGKETSDFYKECPEWYAIKGNDVTGVNADGKEISFVYTPSEE